MDIKELMPDWGDPEAKWTGAQVQAFIKKWLKGLNDEKAPLAEIDGKYHVMYNGQWVEIPVTDLGAEDFNKLWGEAVAT